MEPPGSPNPLFTPALVRESCWHAGGTVSIRKAASEKEKRSEVVGHVGSQAVTEGAIQGKWNETENEFCSHSNLVGKY